MLYTATSSYLPSWQTLVNLPDAGCLWSRRQAAQVEASAVHLAWLKSAIPPNVGNSGVQFLVVGDCVRANPRQMNERWQTSHVWTYPLVVEEKHYTLTIVVLMVQWHSGCSVASMWGLKSNVSHHNCLPVWPLYRNVRAFRWQIWWSIMRQPFPWTLSELNSITY